MRSLEMDANDRIKQEEGIWRPGLRESKSLEKPWKDSAEGWGGNWDSGALKWRSKAKWARE